MGIRNHGTCSSPPRGSHLITPHGDQELRIFATSDQDKSPSLPLMGIRNAINARLKGDHTELITPHGDQERSDFENMASCKNKLITPHGDQELCWGRF